MKRRIGRFLKCVSLTVTTSILNYQVAFADTADSVADDFLKVRLAVTGILIIISVLFVLSNKLRQKCKSLTNSKRSTKIISK